MTEPDDYSAPVPVAPDALAPHIDQLENLIDEQRGTGYLSAKDLRYALRRDTRCFLTVAFPAPEADVDAVIVHSPVEYTVGRYDSDTAPRHDDPVETLPDPAVPVPAAVCLGVFDPATAAFASTFNVQGPDFPPEVAQSDAVGLIESPSIHKEARGHGLGEMVIAPTIDLLTTHGCQVLCAFGWRTQNGVYAADIYYDHGFQAVREYDRYWYEESIQTGFRCAECGPPPCQCSAVFFTRVDV